MSGLALLTVLVGVAATVEDLARRRVSNWIPLTALVAGLTYHQAVSGWRGALSAVLAAAAGFAVFLVFYCLGGMGGGDVKLMAGFGALLGSASHLLEAALWTAAVGGLLALVWLAVVKVLAVWKRHRDPDAPSGRVEFIPYAPAITLGAWMTLMSKS